MSCIFSSSAPENDKSKIEFGSETKSWIPSVQCAFANTSYFDKHFLYFWFNSAKNNVTFGAFVSLSIVVINLTLKGEKCHLQSQPCKIFAKEPYGNGIHFLMESQIYKNVSCQGNFSPCSNPFTENFPNSEMEEQQQSLN